MGNFSYFSQNLWINNSNRSNRSSLIQNWLTAINYEQVTAISTTEKAPAMTSTARIYDMSGRELREEPSKGIFIKNGKKVAR